MNRLYTAADLEAVRRRVRIVLGDGRILGPKVVTPSADGCLHARLMVPKGTVIENILLDRHVLVIEGWRPFASNGEGLSLMMTPTCLGLEPLPPKALRGLN